MMGTHAERALTRRSGVTGVFVLLISCAVFSAVSLEAAPDSSSRLVCGKDCQFLHVSGTPDVSAAGSVATPVGTTYSIQHMLGADLDGSGSITCRSIHDPDLPGAPDDIVVYDGLEEAIRTDITGTVPRVIESKTDYGNETHLIVIDTSAPAGYDLFPGDITDTGTGVLLTDACFVIGYGNPPDPLAWTGIDVVTSASVSFLSDGDVVAGPFDVSGPDYFTVPWNGFFGMTVEDLAGSGVNKVHIEILVGKEAEGLVAACCDEGECLGDVELISCDFQGGHWHPDASCGADPLRPPPVCDHAPYLYHNGFPLDDGGAPISQYAPDVPFGAGAADDFIVGASNGGSQYVQITSLWAWVSHSVAGVDPTTDYQGVNVTVYADGLTKGPDGQPDDDGGHVPAVSGGIRYTQRIPMDSVTVTSAVASCTLDAWKIEIPVGIILMKEIKYWLEVQPIMNAAQGHVLWLYSQNNNDHRAQRIGREFGITQWEEVPGNTDACPDGTPPAGMHGNLAFQLFGAELEGPPNDDCADAMPVGDGITAFTTLGATTDGPDEPEACDFEHYTHLESDVWFDYFTTCSGDLTVSLRGSEYDTKLAVYDACDRCPPSIDPVACNEDFWGIQSEVTLPVVEDRCYRIRIGGYLAAQGDGVMAISCYTPPPPTGACCDDRGECLGTISEQECGALGGTWYGGENCDTFTCPVSPPPHDECYACIPILTGGSYSDRTNGASGSVDLTSCGLNDKKDVWHCWTPDCTGAAIISLCDSEFDTTLAVFDGCGGSELSCNDDYCPGAISRSLISPHQIPSVDLFVTAGETYYIRISGRNDAVGNYTLEVDDCANACCRYDGLCRLKTYADCAAVGATPQGDGTVCLGDNNGNGKDDVCEGCPEATIVAAVPPDGVVDARQPSAPGSALPRQGIGSAEETIKITIDPPEAGAEDCFAVCETAADPLFEEANEIASVTHLGNGLYEIELDHVITAGAVTTIQYTGDGSYIGYTSHPANVNGDSQAAPTDILKTIDYINGADTSPWGQYSEDVDHSGALGPPDILRVIDLLNGAGVFEPWLNTPLPQNTSCPE